MIDPYRDGGPGSRTAFLEEQRQRIARAGRGMVFAAILGLGAAVTVVVAAFAKDRPTLALLVVLPALFSALILQAGRALRRLPGDVHDYAVVERSLRSLQPLYVTKGVLGIAMLTLITCGYCGR